MNVFIGMEESQTIQQAFELRGHNAWSCDLKQGRLNPSRHIQGDVFEVFAQLSWTPDLVIFHPVCQYLSVSGQHWTGKPGQRTIEDRAEAVAEFMRCTQYDGRVCIENPIGIMSTYWRKPDQIIQPYNFGDDASKSTCLWLQQLPKLKSTRYVEPRMTGPYKTHRRWANQTDSGQNKLGPSPTRAADRAKTYPGIAEAMADQWGKL